MINLAIQESIKDLVIADHYIGLIKISSTLNFMILPKIKTEDFLEMVRYVDPSKINALQTLISGLDRDPDSNFVEVFLTYYIRIVHEFLQKELKRGYDEVAEDRLNPRGKISFKENLSNQKNFKPTVFCHYSDFNVNTPHNQLIKFTLIHIKNLVPQQCTMEYNNVLGMLEKTEYKNWSVKMIDGMNYDRLTIGYKEIHGLSRFIIEDIFIVLKSGWLSFYSFLINTWNYFEKFLFEIFRRFAKGYTVTNSRPKNEEHLDNNENSNYISETDLGEDSDVNNNYQTQTEIQERPDIIISKDDKPVLIIDAKYKNQPTRADLNQMIVYLGAYNLSKGYLVCPCETETPCETKIITQHEKRVAIIIQHIQLNRIKDQKYLEDFVKQSIL